MANLFDLHCSRAELKQKKPSSELSIGRGEGKEGHSGRGVFERKLLLTAECDYIAHSILRNTISK